MLQQNNHCLEIETMLSRTNILNDGKDHDAKLYFGVKACDDLRRRLDDKQGVDICLILDKSHSMDYIVDPSTASPTNKRINVEGKMSKVSSTGVTRFKVALEAAHSVVDMMKPEDTISCILFADMPVTIFANRTGREKEAIKKMLDYKTVKAANCGRSTNITNALREASNLFDSNKSPNVKKIIFLTDGEPTLDTKEQGINQAKKIANKGITLDCIGIGSKSLKTKKSDQANYSYIQSLASPSNGKSSLIYDAEEAKSIFKERMKNTEDVLITDAKLHLTFSNSVRVTEHFRATPENTYLGKVKLNKNRQCTLLLGQIEKNQMYKYYMQLTIPGQKGYAGEFVIAKAELEYKIPALYNDTILKQTLANYNNKKEYCESFKITATSVSDSYKAKLKDAAVEEKYMLCEIKRLEAESEIALEKGDRDTVIALYQKIIDTYTFLQNLEEAKMYESVLEGYRNTNEVKPAIWNRVTSTTAQMGETGMLSDLTVEESNSFIGKTGKSGLGGKFKTGNSQPNKKQKVLAFNQD